MKAMIELARRIPPPPMEAALQTASSSTTSPAEKSVTVRCTPAACPRTERATRSIEAQKTKEMAEMMSGDIHSMKAARHTMLPFSWS